MDAKAKLYDQETKAVPTNFNEKNIICKTRNFYILCAFSLITQGRREGNSSVAFEVLIMNCEIDFMNLFIFNYLQSNINLFIFNCLALMINLFIFHCLTSNFCFPKNKYFAGRKERLFMDVRPYFRILNSPGKMMTCYLRDTNKFLRYRALCTNILKFRSPARGIELTRLVPFEVLRVLQL